MAEVVALHDDIGEAMAQDQVTAVEELAPEQRALQFQHRRHHQAGDLPEVHRRQAGLQDLRLHLPRHVRVKGDLLHVELLAQVDDLRLDLGIVDHRAGRGRDQPFLVPGLIGCAGAILAGADAVLAIQFAFGVARGRVDGFLRAEEPGLDEIALGQPPAGHDDRKVNRRGQVHRQPARLVPERVHVEVLVPRVIDVHVHEGIGRGIEPDVQLQLLEGLPVAHAALRALGVTPEAGKAGIAMLQAGVHPMPQRLVLPVIAAVGLEQDGQDRGIVHLAARHVAGVLEELPGQAVLSPAGGRCDDQQAVVYLLKPGGQGFPEVAALPDVDLVGQHETGRSTMLRPAIARDHLQIGGLFPIEQLFGCVVRVIDADGRDQALVLADDASRLAKADAGLLAVGGGKDRLAAGPLLGSDGVEKCQRGREAGFAVPARQQQRHGVDDARAILVPGAIDAAHDAFLPGIQLEGTVWQDGFRVPQGAQELHRALAMPVGVRDQRAVIDPFGEGRSGCFPFRKKLRRYVCHPHTFTPYPAGSDCGHRRHHRGSRDGTGIPGSGPARPPSAAPKPWPCPAPGSA